ncbi:MAG: oxygenase MpaB family protein [Bacteroidota bacterium]
MPANFKLLWNDDFLEKKRQLTDDPADKIIRRLVLDKGPQEAKRIFDTLISNIHFPLNELPTELIQFFARNRDLPEWADKEQMKIAQDLFVDHGPKFLTFLYYKSLPTLYACKKGAQVLVQTGRLAHEDDKQLQFSRRIAETGQFLLDVMVPGGFDQGGKAVESIMKVRLVHASIRKFIPPERWDKESLGAPINQEDMACTLLTFSISLLDGLHQFGVPASPEQEEAYMHHWRIIGHFLGVQADLLPDTVKEGRYLLDKVLFRQTEVSEAGIILTDALIRFTTDNLHSDFFPEAPKITMQFLLGDEKSAKLGVQPKSGCMSVIMPEFIKSFFKIVDRLEDRSEPIEAILDQISLIVIRQSVNYFNTYKGQKFRIPENLQKAWKL